MLTQVQERSVEALRVHSTLEGLIQTLKNGQKAYSIALEGVTDGNLKDLFMAYARQRARFAAELEEAARRLPGAMLPASMRSTRDPRGRMPRGWIHIRSALSGQDECGLLCECGRGEVATLKSYEEALAARLPESLKAIIRKQYLEVRKACQTIRSLENLD